MNTDRVVERGSPEGVSQPLFRTLSHQCSSASICGFNCFFEVELRALLAPLKYLAASSKTQGISLSKCLVAID